GGILLGGPQAAATPGAFKLRSGAVTGGPAPAPPTPRFSSRGAGHEGSPGEPRVTSVTGAGPFSYSYDFDNDGVFDVVNSTAATATVPASYLSDGSRIATLRGRVTAATGAFADYTTSITVNNVAPQATLGAMPVGVLEGGTVTV